MKPAEIAELAQLACLLEASAFPKPGNASPCSRKAELEYEHFLKAAVAVRKTFEKAAEKGKKAREGKLKLKEIGLGKLFLQAARDTTKLAGETNVNAGIITLLVPLCAAEGYGGVKHAKKIVEAAGEQDSAGLIQMAQTLCPRVPERKDLGIENEGTAREVLERKITLKELLKQSFGSVPKELVNGFKKTREAAREIRRARKAGANWNDCVCQAFLKLLAKYPDSLVELKFGKEKAKEVSRKAKEILLEESMLTEKGRKKAEKLDEEFKRQGINPGATADLVCAGIFTFLIQESSGKGLKK